MSLRNTRPRCTYKEAGDKKYQVQCDAVVITPAGNEVLATSIAPGITLDWKEPKKVEGGEVSVSACSVASSQLSQECSIELAAPVASKVQFDLTLREKDQENTESDTLLLPFSAESFGRVGFLMDYQNSGTAKGYAAVETPVNEVSYVKPSALCRMGERIFVLADDAYVYVIENGKSRLYLGSPNRANQDLSHRLRFSMRRADGLSMACGKDVLYIGNRARKMLYEVRDAGAIAAHSVTVDALSFGNDGKLYFTNGTDLYRWGDAQPVIRSGETIFKFVATKDGAIYFSRGAGHVLEKRFPIGEVRKIYEEPNSLLYSLHVSGDDHVYGMTNAYQLKRFDTPSPQIAVESIVTRIQNFIEYRNGFLAFDANDNIVHFGVSGVTTPFTLSEKKAPMVISQQYDASTSAFGRIGKLAIGIDDSVYVLNGSQISKISRDGKVVVVYGGRDEAKIQALALVGSELFISGEVSQKTGIWKIGEDGQLSHVLVGSPPQWLESGNGGLYLGKYVSAFDRDAAGVYTMRGTYVEGIRFQSFSHAGDTLPNAGLFAKMKEMARFPLAIDSDGSGYYLELGNIRRLYQKDGAYETEMVIEPKAQKDCSGVIKKQFSRATVENDVQVSLSQICFGEEITAFAIRRFCGAEESDPHISMAFAQSFGASSNVVRIRRPCR